MHYIKTIFVISIAILATTSGVLLMNEKDGLLEQASASSIKTIHISNFQWKGVRVFDPFSKDPLVRYETNIRFRGKVIGKKYYRIKKLTFDSDYKRVKSLKLLIFDKTGTKIRSSKNYDLKGRRTIALNYKAIRGAHIHMTIRADLPNQPDRDITKKERL